MDPLFELLPEDFAPLSTDELVALAAQYQTRMDEILADPSLFTTDARTLEDVAAECEAAMDELDALRAEVTSRAEVPAPAEAPAPAATPAAAATPEDRLAALAARATAEHDEDEEPATPEDEEPATPEDEAAAATPPAPATPVVAAAAPRRRLPVPPASRQPLESERELTPLVAATGAVGHDLGDRFADELALADAMIGRRRQFDDGGGAGRENFSIARADWRGRYADDRHLSMDEVSNMGLVAAALSPANLKAELRARRDGAAKGALVASGGLCAPVTPYYQLQMLSTSGRPVRSALPAFNADRGGIRYARPAALTSIVSGSGIGSKTVAQDAAGGTTAAKTCQTIDCPSFTETDVAIIYHCLRFGNLGARAFPELVAQWNQLVLAALARAADSALLTGIDAASTQVTATSQGFGATAALLGQILAAANGMRNRHRMDPEAVLRLLIPDWAIDLLISDVIRGQFARFDTDEAKITALLRSFDVEPTFYVDGANGKSQVFGAQTAGALLPFPSTVNWFLYPEGSFLFLDGGTLELGIVRDSVLNAANDFQIFGEFFENVAFIGVESLSVTSTLCDSGTVSAPHATTCPINYGA